ncbi:amidase family protein [Sulfitobacter porphyrae]|uniref:Amidase family protein n=1 Tax=Sulfitobacter porphyrae TaxID=1246864 RepID=A0ABW2BC66_9RHOB
MEAGELIQNITDLSRKLLRGKLSSRDLVDETFAAIDAAGEEGTKVFLSTYKDAARAQADWIDSGRKAGIDLPPHAGIPIAIKDLFDVKGEVTRAGSRVLDENPRRPRRRYRNKTPPGGVRDRRQEQHDRIRLFGPGCECPFRYANKSQ